MSTTAKRYIFRNKKPYDVEIPTANGAGRTIPPGCYVEGDFYLPLYQQSNFFELMPENHKYDPKLLVVSLYRNDITNQLIDQIKGEHAVKIAEQRKVEDEIAQIPIKKSETVLPNITTSLQQTITEAMKATPRLMPTAEEISAMSTPDLKALAETLGVTYISPKTAFVKAIKSKLANMG